MATTCKKQGKMLAFGSGGGFSGQQIVYVLHEDGNIYKHDGIGAIKEIKPLKKIKKSVTKKLFKQFASLSENDKDFSNPGNMWYMIGYQEGDAVNFETLKQTTWGNEKPVPIPVKVLYDKLMDLVKE